MHILVLGGGNSPEREVSLRSAAAVSSALQKAGFTVTQADPTDGYKVLDNLEPGTIVFPILHGVGGEDGEVQTELQQRNLPFLGSEASVSAICFDKGKAREIYEKAGIPIARGAVVTRETYANHELAKGPHVLKVTRGGSSIGTMIARDPSMVHQEDISEVFKLNEEAILEELIKGVEITVPIFGSQSLPVIEIQPPETGEFDYENKYNGATKEICPPVSIDAAAQARAQDLGIKAHQALGCRHLSRTDIMVDKSGQMFVLETNTMPGMTDQSLFPLAAKEAGMSMQALMSKFVEMVKQDYNL
jgi:D-alanine-D-alanine ligase